MAARKKAPAKKSEPLGQKAQEAKWKRESDLRTMQEAEQIQADPARFRGAQREAREQQKALSRVIKKKA